MIRRWLCFNCRHETRAVRQPERCPGCGSGDAYYAAVPDDDPRSPDEVMDLVLDLLAEVLPDEEKKRPS